MNIIIVDDELDVLEGLKKIVNWNELGFHICATAQTGDEAIKKISYIRPELVLLDIRMPHYTGLQIIEEIHKRNLECEFIILSGYSEFSYAQQAVNLGAVSYLLKPVDEDELAAAVQKAKEIIRSKNKIVTKIDKYRDKARNEIFVDLFHGKMNPGDYEIEELQLGASKYMVVFVEPFNSEHRIEIWNFELLLKSAGNLQKQKDYEKIILENREYYLLKNERTIKIYEKMAKLLSNQVEVNSPLDAMFIVQGRMAADLNEIYLSFNDIEDIRENRFFCNPNQHIILYQEKNSESRTDDFILPEIDNVIALVLSNDREAICKLLDNTISIGKKTKHKPKEVRRIMLDFMLHLKQKLVISNYDLANIFPSNKEIIEKISDEIYFTEIVQYIREILCKITEEKSSDIIEDVVNYIDHNYQFPIRLETIATLFGYNSSYLGKIFMTKKGVSFNTYLDNVRINAAIKLICSNVYTMNEIAEKVGYKESGYLYKKLKKYTGLTPKEIKSRKS